MTGTNSPPASANFATMTAGEPNREVPTPVDEPPKAEVDAPPGAPEAKPEPPPARDFATTVGAIVREHRAAAWVVRKLAISPCGCGAMNGLRIRLSKYGLID